MRQRPGPRGTPVDAPGLCPDRLLGLERAAIERQPIRVGRSDVPLAEIFEVTTDAGGTVEVEGDLSAFARVGASMSRGRLVVRGDVGPRAGAGMSGGTLIVEGAAGDHAGEAMTGGLLRIRGDAGDHLAAPPPGGSRGMNRGTILVDGSAGGMAAMRMRRGLVAVAGDVGEGAACGMLAGTLLVFGRVGSGAGALQRRGTLLALGGLEPLVTFLPVGSFRFPFLELFFDGLESAGFPVPPRARRASYHRHVGDVSGGGVGEILVLESRP